MSEDQAIDFSTRASAGTPGGQPEPAAGRDAAYAAVLDRLRAAYIAAEPALQAAMLRGETLEELEASHASAMATLAAVRAAVAREAAIAPAGGAPGRATAGPATAFEKIRDGLARLPGP